jgi:DNA-binding Lrp family transcriptional regulator
MTRATPIDETDRRLIRATQGGLPLSVEPYAEVAEALDLTPEEVVARLRRMLSDGIVRRVGAVPNHYALGYRANGMSVWDVLDTRVEERGRQIGDLPFVSHCYRRPRRLPDWPYNLFAMVHGRDRNEVEAKVVQIAALLGPDSRGHDVLYSSRILKKTGLRLGEKG